MNESLMQCLERYRAVEKHKLLLLIIVPILSMSILGCELATGPADEETELGLIERNFPADFDFNTKRNVAFLLRAVSNTNEALSHVKVTAYGIDESGLENRLFTAFTNSEGVIARDYPVATIFKTVIIRTAYPGIIHSIEKEVIDDKVEVDFLAIDAEAAEGGEILGKGTSADDLHFLSTFNPHGKPFDLVKPKDPIRQEFLNDVNASLPEGIDVTVVNPDYLAEDKQSNTLLSQPADVWVTYFHEGTDSKNVLGFYHYPADNPPASLDEIDSISIIFPNASYPGGGGNLRPGDKMYIGNFPAGTEIGWVLFADGWAKKVTFGDWQFYSDPAFNPETDPTLRQHNILLYDAARDITILGFEDENRENSSDNDFNDVLFFVTSNPRSAISNVNVSSLTYTGQDQDGDGAMDHVDSYPDNPSLAYDNYYPSQNFFGSLAFEDLWPNKGDYDFNDMVIDYRFRELLNAENQVVQLDVALVIKAVGASYENGFGFEMNATPELISSVVGPVVTGSAVTLADNGTEAGQDKAVIVAFDKTSNIAERPAGAYLNTQLDAPVVNADTLDLSITFTDAIDQSELGIPPYNPFLIVDQNREKEIHLPGNAPTTLALNSGLFDTGDDNSSEAGYYRTFNNLPWALDIFEPLDYPVERVTIDSAHIYFVTWAETAGQSYSDWYKNLPGYRRPEKIFQK